MCDTVGNQRGSASAELAILAPGIVMLALMLAMGARIGWAQTQITDAVAAAARAASLERSGSAAKLASHRAVEANLVDAGLHCQPATVNVDVTGFTLPAGQDADVTVGIECRLSLAGLGFAGFPGSVNLSAHTSERIDTYRSRQP